MDLQPFETYLRQGNMAENTISAYLYALKEFDSRYKELNCGRIMIMCLSIARRLM